MLAVHNLPTLSESFNSLPSLLSLHNSFLKCYLQYPRNRFHRRKSKEISYSKLTLVAEACVWNSLQGWDLTKVYYELENQPLPQGAVFTCVYKYESVFNDIDLF